MGALIEALTGGFLAALAREQAQRLPKRSLSHLRAGVLAEIAHDSSMSS